jgi:hypothetical protein
MTKAEELDFQAYLDGQAEPELTAMEMAADRGPVPYSPEAFDEMVRDDLAGRS